VRRVDGDSGNQGDETFFAGQTGETWAALRCAMRTGRTPHLTLARFGINMMDYGSDYLLGLANVAPENLLSATGCGSWRSCLYALSDGVAVSGRRAFAKPVPGVTNILPRSSALQKEFPAICLIRKNTRRPAWEAEMLSGLRAAFGY